ncbi:MAG TPA: orotate phosphoribosyltransferase [Oculatellaceae cyanobacterium]
MSAASTKERQTPEQVLKSVGAWLTGHFLFTSGLHGSDYMQCQRVLQYPRYGLSLAEQLVESLIEKNLIPDTVVGPALGAIHWEVLVATALDQAFPDRAPTRGIFAERVTDDAGDQNAFAIRRGLELAPREKVLVVEDVTTTGGSARKVVELVRRLGADPIAVGAIIDRSGSKIDFGIPFVKLITLDLPAYKESECPMCAAGTKAVKPGSSKQ